MLPRSWVDSNFLTRWVLANGVGGVAGTIINGRISFSVDLIATGAAAGIMQGLALRWPILLVALWTFATATGGFFGGVVGGDLRAAVGGRLGFATGLIAAGATVGIAQGIVLQGQIPRFGWWIVANAAAGVLGGVAGHETFELFGGIFGAFAGRAVGGTVIGVVTGFALTRLLQNPAGSE
jgi:hypothetical protein